MADSLCGPSTALKSLGDHVHRDRSLQQDRLAHAGPAGHAGVDFRSSPAGPSQDADFHAFTAGPHPTTSLAGPGQLPTIPDLASHHHYQPPPPSFAPTMAAHTPPAFHAGTAGWATEFAALRGIVPSGAAAASAATHQANGFSAAATTARQANGSPAASMQRYNTASYPAAYGRQPPPSLYGLPTMMPDDVAYRQQQPLFPAPVAAAATATASSPSGVAGLTEEELDARFAAYEQDLALEQETGQWTEHGRGEATQDERADAMFEQMAAALEAQRLEGPLAEAAVPLADEPVAQDPRDRERAVQDDLARTAEDIVQTLDAHPSRRFRESAFAALLRRIQAREVTVQGDVLFDHATGKPLETSAGTEAEAEAETATEPQRTEAAAETATESQPERPASAT